MMKKTNFSRIISLLFMVVFIALLFLISRSNVSLDEKYQPLLNSEKGRFASNLHHLGIEKNDSLSTELKNIRKGINTNQKALYFSKKNGVLYIYCVDITSNTLNPMKIMLDSNGVYKYNTDFSNTDVLECSKIIKVLPAPQKSKLTWSNLDYNSSQFPTSLKWQKDYTASYEAKKDTTYMTVNGIDTNVTKISLDHFFIWATNEYMRHLKTEKLYYVIDTSAPASVIECISLNIDYANNSAFRGDSISSVQANQAEVSDTSFMTYTFYRNRDGLTIQTDSKSHEIPTIYNEQTKLNTVEKFVHRSSWEELRPLLISLEQADRSINSWDKPDHQSEKFIEYLALHIKYDRWEYFVSYNKDKKLGIYLLNTILFQLEESNAETFELSLSPESYSISSRVSDFQYKGYFLFLIIFGLTISSITYFWKRNQKQPALSAFPNRRSAQKSDQGGVENNNVNKEKAEDPNASDDEDLDCTNTSATIDDPWKKLNDFNSLDEFMNYLSEYGTNPSIVNKLKRTFENSQSLEELRSKEDFTSFLTSMKIEFKYQEVNIQDQIKKVNAWNELNKITVKEDVETFADRYAEILEDSCWLKNLGTGIEFTKIMESEKFDDLLGKLRKQDCFKDEISSIENIKNIFSKKSFSNSANVLVEESKNLYNKTQQADSVIDFLDDLSNWQKSIFKTIPSWKNRLIKIKDNLNKIDNNLTPKSTIEEYEKLYNTITYKDMQTASGYLDKIEDLETKMEVIQKYFEILSEYIDVFENNIYKGVATPKMIVKDVFFITYNVIDFTAFVNGNFSLKGKKTGNIKQIMKRHKQISPNAQTYDPDIHASAYVNRIIQYLRSQQISNIDHLIDGFDVNNELK